jgi:sulfatase modifying factor 1
MACGGLTTSDPPDAMVAAAGGPSAPVSTEPGDTDAGSMADSSPGTPADEFWPPPPSCGDGLDCGGLSCCESVAIPGGSFAMGRSESGLDACPPDVRCGEHETPEHTAIVNDFRLDTFEVTVGRFRTFVASYDGWRAAGNPVADAGSHPLIAGSGWQPSDSSELPPTAAELRQALACNPDDATWTDQPAGGELYPIACVTWYEAFAFCIFDGGRLPTEAEWEYAAAGGAENRLYPWGSAAPDLTLANYAFSFDAPFIPVGATPAGNARWRQRDLAGSAWEWVLDTLGENWYSNGGYDCNNCANLDSGPDRVVRGGAFKSYPQQLRSAYRIPPPVPPDTRGSAGIRCARNTPAALQ